MANEEISTVLKRRGVSLFESYRFAGLPAGVHAYFHDTDLLSARRRRLIVAALGLLGRLRPPTDLDTLASFVGAQAPSVEWGDVARGRAAEPPT